MNKKTAIKLFEQQQLRSHWNDDEEKWYFSVVDVVQILTESKDVASYWRKLKQRLKAEGNQTVTNLHGLKMRAPDGKMRQTDVANTEQLFLLIQSILSPKAEPFKLDLKTKILNKFTINPTQKFGVIFQSSDFFLSFY